MAREFYRKARERGLDVKFGLAAAVMQALLMAPLSALSGVVMFYVLGSLTSGRAALFLALLYAFATPVFYRTAQLNQNLLVSHFTFFAFALLWRPWDKPVRPQNMLVAAAEEERFTRKKHDYEFPQNAIDFCLKAGALESGDLDYVVFFEKPFLKFERLLISSLPTFPRAHKVFREAMISWLGDKLWIKQLIQKRLGVVESKILFSDHHMSHAERVLSEDVETTEGWILGVLCTLLHRFERRFAFEHLETIGGDEDRLGRFVHGLFLVVYRTWDALLVRQFGIQKVRAWRMRWPVRLSGIALTFNATAFAFIFFRIDTAQIEKTLSRFVSL